MNLNGTEYYYIRNAQGDIIGLYDKNGAQVVSYTYDSWGKIISIDGSLKDSVGVKNSYRYRGYRYDTEAGLYYLQSRYYNPEWGRFINADATIGNPGELLTHNLYAYCVNNPIIMEDPDGFGGQVIDLGGGWKARIDPGILDMKLQRHAHVYKGKGEWAQNEDGSPHDQGKNSPGDPPNSVKKALKKKTGWDWDKKAKEYKGKKKKEQTKKAVTGVVVVGGGYLVYRAIRFIPSLAPPLWWTIPGNLAIP
ncbi:RHS repeat-associated core domain-containing protein [Clostridium sp. JNZ J1-5]